MLVTRFSRKWPRDLVLGLLGSWTPFSLLNGVVFFVAGVDHVRSLAIVVVIERIETLVGFRLSVFIQSKAFLDF